MHVVCGSFIDWQMSKQKSKTEENKKNMRKETCRVRDLVQAHKQAFSFHGAH